MANNNSQIENVVILGNGPSGCTAALYTARANLGPLVFEGNQPGGQLITTTEVENFPGFESILGVELVEKMKKQSENFGARFQTGLIKKITKDEKTNIFTLETDENTKVQTRSVILATGATAKKVGCKGEEQFWSHGITACATCDGFFYKGKEVVVIGGGDSAMEEATFLTRFCPTVYLLHRRESFRASKVMIDRALKNPKIKPIYNVTVDEIHGDTSLKGLQVTGVTLFDTKTQEKRLLPVGGVFYAIGHTPNSDCVRDIVTCDSEGYVIAQGVKTNVTGLFACGDVSDKVYRQAITSAGAGCQAALEVEHYLESL